jgi:hypothetical protein
MQDTGDLNRLLSDAVNNDEREAGDKHFPRVGLAAFSSTVRHVLQRGGGFIDRVCHTAGLRCAETFCGVIADVQKIVRSGLRPANEH